MCYLMGLVPPVCVIVDFCSPISIQEAVEPLVALWHVVVCHNSPSSSRQCR